jgi:hypothetical protein
VAIWVDIAKSTPRLIADPLIIIIVLPQYHLEAILPPLEVTINSLHFLPGRAYNVIIVKSITHSNSATIQLLLALVPYTKQNLSLSFHPQRFFDELAAETTIPKKTLRTAYTRAVQKELIVYSDQSHTFSLKARQAVQPFIAQKLPSGGQLMVIFDIPEDIAHARQQFRYFLKRLSFEQIQQSVWMSDMDHRAIIIETIDDLNLGPYIQLFEAAKI